MKLCSNCNEELYHRQRLHFGKAERGKGKGKKRVKRVVTSCLACGHRVVDNKRKASKRVKRFVN